MHNLKENIANIKSQLAEIQSQLKPWLNKSAKSEIQSQLNAIVKSSDSLTKTDVNVPTELRELKFKLIKELDKFNEAEKLQEELMQILSQYVFIKQQRTTTKQIKEITAKKGRSKSPHFSLMNFINDGLLTPNTKLVKKHKGGLHTGILTKEGYIQLNHNGNITLHDSPSSAAVHITQASQNGWAWWAVEGDEKGKTLDYYRQQYLKKQNETRG